MTTHDLGSGFVLELEYNAEDELVNFDLAFEKNTHAYRALPFDMINIAKGQALSHIIIGMAQEIVMTKLATSGTGIDIEMEVETDGRV